MKIFKNTLILGLFLSTLIFSGAIAMEAAKNAASEFGYTMVWGGNPYKGRYGMDMGLKKQLADAVYKKQGYAAWAYGNLLKWEAQALNIDKAKDDEEIQRLKKELMMALQRLSEEDFNSYQRGLDLKGERKKDL